MRSDCCVFILSHQRAGNVKTLKSLAKHGYTGPIRIIIDDEDPQRHLYLENYKDLVIVFKKSEYDHLVDKGDNFFGRRTAIFARRAVYDIAKNLGFPFFIQMDDDLTSFRFRFDENLDYFTSHKMLKMDALVDIVLDFLEKSNSTTVSFSLGGDFIGGKQGTMAKSIQFKRKAMGIFFCKVDRFFPFLGRMNDDVSSYINYGKLGYLYWILPQVSMDTDPTQQTEGGCTEVYQEFGTYIKSLYSVIFEPSCVAIQVLNTSNPRLHHRIIWENAIPCILREEHRKKE